MSRDELAKRLWLARHADAIDAEWPDGVDDAYRDELMRLADVALAVVREAVRDAYREGAIDAVRAAGQDKSLSGAELAEMAYDESARWKISDTLAKWSAK